MTNSWAELKTRTKPLLCWRQPMNEITNLFKTQASIPTFDQIKISIASPDDDPLVVVR